MLFIRVEYNYSRLRYFPIQCPLATRSYLHLLTSLLTFMKIGIEQFFFYLEMHLCISSRSKIKVKVILLAVVSLFKETDAQVFLQSIPAALQKYGFSNKGFVNAIFSQECYEGNISASLKEKVLVVSGCIHQVV